MHNNKEEIVTDPENKVEIITDFFESLFKVDNVAPFSEIPPQKLTNPFTAEEIGKCSKKTKER